jgi:hypothetical protein
MEYGLDVRWEGTAVSSITSALEREAPRGLIFAPDDPFYGWSDVRRLFASDRGGRLYTKP